MEIKRNIEVEFVSTKPVEEQAIEMVERKGLGHPDSLCDGIAEAVSIALCKEYKKKCGIILHHNTDNSSSPVGQTRNTVVVRSFRRYAFCWVVEQRVNLKARKSQLMP